jgi:hypothetical protein
MVDKRPLHCRWALQTFHIFAKISHLYLSFSNFFQVVYCSIFSYGLCNNEGVCYFFMCLIDMKKNYINTYTLKLKSVLGSIQDKILSIHISHIKTGFISCCCLKPLI